MMPDTGFAPVELAEYNRQCAMPKPTGSVISCMHYITGRRGEPFWKDFSAIKPRPHLPTLALFAERGRLPYYEEETFARESWAAVLLGQGCQCREALIR